MGNNSLQLLLNFEDITDTITQVNDTNDNSTLVFFERTAENSILTTFSVGVSLSVSASFGIMSFVTTVPQEMQGSVTGLLGNFNGDSTDDLSYRNGTMLDRNSTDRMIHELGQTCKCVSNYSIVTIIIHKGVKINM